MNRILLTIIILLSFLIFFEGAVNPQNSNKEIFEVADIYLEQNATDKDIEVVIEIKGGDEGFANLKILSPGNQEILNLTTLDHSLGLRQFRFESPEPKNFEKLKVNFPEGNYKFYGTTTSGKIFYGEAILSHTLPETTTLINPSEEETDTDNLLIEWKPVKNVNYYLLEIDQEESNINLSVKIPASQTSFEMPRNFLNPDHEFALSIGTVSKENNRSFIENSFFSESED
jgi:hypothetical protein